MAFPIPADLARRAGAGATRVDRVEPRAGLAGLAERGEGGAVGGDVEAGDRVHVHTERSAGGHLAVVRVGVAGPELGQHVEVRVDAEEPRGARSANGVGVGDRADGGIGGGVGVACGERERRVRDRCPSGARVEPEVVVGLVVDHAHAIREGVEVEALVGARDCAGARATDRGRRRRTTREGDPVELTARGRSNLGDAIELTGRGPNVDPDQRLPGHQAGHGDRIRGRAGLGRGEQDDLVGAGQADDLLGGHRRRRGPEHGHQGPCTSECQPSRWLPYLDHSALPVVRWALCHPSCRAAQRFTPKLGRAGKGARDGQFPVGGARLPPC